MPLSVVDRRRYSAADSQHSSSAGGCSAAASEPASGDESEQEASPSAVHIDIPATLRRRLDDDYYYINKYHKVTGQRPHGPQNVTADWGR